MTAHLKQVRHIDDSLDVFAVHGVGGILGTLLTAFLATEAFGGLGVAVDGGPRPSSACNCSARRGRRMAALTYGIVKVVGAAVPLRVSEVVELEGSMSTSTANARTICGALTPAGVRQRHRRRRLAAAG